MKRLNAAMVESWRQFGPRFLPFADAASDALPLGRLLRLSLFQVSVGMAVTLLTGTLNRVMILELAVPAWLVSVMIALPLIFAPFRALIGHNSDNHRSYLGWRRVPYIWFGTLLQFGGLSFMPFAILLMSEGGGPLMMGHIATALAFLLMGAGLHTTQTAGLALATDISSEENRPRVVALLYVMLLVGMVASSVAFSFLLENFNNVVLIRVIQGAATLTLVLNVIALWKQEARNPALTAHDRPRNDFRQAWQAFAKGHRAGRLLVTIGLGTLAFSMQDILLEPYGGEILGLTVSETTLLTALLAGGTLAGFAVAARQLGNGVDAYRLAALGALAGIFAFSAVILASPFGSALLFRIGTVMIGFGGGLFAVGMLTATMALAQDGESGIALGAWGAVQATAAGIGIALGGAIRDVVSGLAAGGRLGPALADPAVGYGAVYQLEIILLFATLIALGPLVRSAHSDRQRSDSRFGLPEFPG